MAKSKALTTSNTSNQVIQSHPPVTEIELQKPQNVWEEALYGEIPKHAIKKRKGKGGEYTYVPHGYVANELNKVFHYGWDFRLMPVFDSSIYKLTTVEEGGETVKNIAVYGELVIKWPTPEGGLIEMTRSGMGSQNWLPKMEFGDACKGAESDALKRAAHTLGKRFGLQLYWDDEFQQEQYTEANTPRPPQPPQNIDQWLKRTEQEGITDEECVAATGKEIGDIDTKPEIIEAWEKIQQARELQNAKTV